MARRRAVRRLLIVGAVLWLGGTGVGIGWWGADRATDRAWLQWRREPLTLTRVIDGRTLELRRADDRGADTAPIKVRLLGVDAAAESDTTCRDWLVETCDAQTLRLSFPPHPGVDDDGCWGAFVYLDTGLMLNEAALESGYARREALGFDAELDGWLLRLENRARYDDRGVWAPR